MMQDIMAKIEKYTGITRFSDKEIVTPMNIVKDMVDLLPEEVFIPGATFFDPAVKMDISLTTSSELNLKKSVIGS